MKVYELYREVDIKYRLAGHGEMSIEDFLVVVTTMATENKILIGNDNEVEALPRRDDGENDGNNMP